MRFYQPLLVATIVGLLLTGCYYVPNGEATGDLAFLFSTRAATDPTFNAVRIELSLEQGGLFDTPLAIGADGELYLDVPIEPPKDGWDYDHGPITVADIPARRRYVLRVSTFDYDSGSGFVNGPRDSSPFEVLPGQTAYVAVSFC